MSRRPPPPADGGGGSSRGVVLLVVALLLGIFILSKTHGGTSSATSSVRVAAPPATTAPTTRAGKAVTTAPPATSRPARPPGEVKVLPANGSGVAGLGGRVGEKVRAKGYNTLAPANTTKDIASSVVEYAADFEQEARQVAEALGLPATAVKALEPSPPVADTKGADVVVLIGPDLETAGNTTTTRR